MKFLFAPPLSTIRALSLGMLFILLGGSFSVSAQSRWEEDVLYLRNGSLLRGTHIRTGSVDSITFQLRDGQVLRFSQEEVETLQREATRHHRIRSTYGVGGWRPPYVFQPGFYRRLGYGIAMGSNGSYANVSPFVDVVMGYRFSPFLEVGVGTGFHAYEEGLLIPAYVDIGSRLLKTRISPVVHLQAGYGFTMLTNWRNELFRGGIMLHPSAGLRIPTRKSQSLQVSLGYRHQPSFLSYTDFVWDPNTNSQIEFAVEGARVYRRITLQIGVIF